MTSESANLKVRDLSQVSKGSPRKQLLDQLNRNKSTTSKKQLLPNDEMDKLMLSDLKKDQFINLRIQKEMSIFENLQANYDKHFEREKKFLKEREEKLDKEIK